MALCDGSPTEASGGMIEVENMESSLVALQMLRNEVEAQT